MINPNQIKGKLFDGETTSAKVSTLEIQDNHLILKFDDCQLIYSVTNTKVTGRIANIPRIFYFQDGKQFETLDNDTVDILLPKRIKLIHRFEKSWRLALGAAVFVMILVIFVYKIGLPHLANFVAPRLPLKFSRVISQQIRSTIDETDFLQPSKLNSIERESAQVAFHRLLRQYPDLKLIYKAGKLNAFALPDGTLYITDELIMLVKESKYIYAILLHEVGHVKNYHGVKILITYSGLAIVLSTLLGNADVMSLPMLLMSNSYSRESETEADDFAATQLKKNGLSPNILAEALELLEEKNPSHGSMPSFMSTHPATVDRISRLKLLE